MASWSSVKEKKEKKTSLYTICQKRKIHPLGHTIANRDFPFFFFFVIFLDLVIERLADKVGVGAVALHISFVYGAQVEGMGESPRRAESRDNRCINLGRTRFL